MKKPKHIHRFRFSHCVDSLDGKKIIYVCRCGKERTVSTGKKKSIKAFSTKGRIRSDEYRRLRNADPRNKICLRCQSTESIDCHHPKGRVGDNLYYFIFLCRPCHDWAHANPSAAKEDGYIEKR